VWFICNEESLDELKRKLAATLLKNGIAPAEIAGRIFLSSGEDLKLTVAAKDNYGQMRVSDVVEAMSRFIAENEIVHIAIDPLVSTYEGADESDNSALEKVMTALRTIAQKGDCSVDVLHHTNKVRTRESRAGDPMSARGASSIIAAARQGYTITDATADEKKMFATKDWLVAVTPAKGNYTRKKKRAGRFFILRSVNLMNGPDGSNGDEVGVAEFVAMAPEGIFDDEQQEIDMERNQMLTAVFNAFEAGENKIRQSNAADKIKTALGKERTVIYETLDAMLPLGQEQEITIAGDPWLLLRRKTGRHQQAPIEIVRCEAIIGFSES
jgi:hypothetical protein